MVEKASGLLRSATNRYKNAFLGSIRNVPSAAEPLSALSRDMSALCAVLYGDQWKEH